MPLVPFGLWYLFFTNSCSWSAFWSLLQSPCFSSLATYEAVRWQNPLEELLGGSGWETSFPSVIHFSLGMLKGFSHLHRRRASSSKHCQSGKPTGVVWLLQRAERERNCLHLREAVRDFWKCFWIRKERQIWDAFETDFGMPAEALGWVQWPDYKMRWVMLPTLWKKDYLGLFPAVLQNPHVTQDESLKFNFLLFTCLKNQRAE